MSKRKVRSVLVWLDQYGADVRGVQEYYSVSLLGWDGDEVRRVGGDFDLGLAWALGCNLADRHHVFCVKQSDKNNMEIRRYTSLRRYEVVIGPPGATIEAEWDDELGAGGESEKFGTLAGAKAARDALVIAWATRSPCTLAIRVAGRRWAVPGSMRTVGQTTLTTTH